MASIDNLVKEENYTGTSLAIDLMRKVRDSRFGSAIKILLAGLTAYGPMAVRGLAQELENYTAIIQPGEIADIEALLQSVTVSNASGDDKPLDFLIQSLDDGRYKVTLQIPEEGLSSDVIDSIQSLIWGGQSTDNDLTETKYGFQITKNNGNFVVADIKGTFNTDKYDGLIVNSRSSVKTGESHPELTVAASQGDSDWDSGIKPTTLENIIQTSENFTSTRVPFKDFNVQADDREGYGSEQNFYVEPNSDVYSLLIWSNDAPEGSSIEVDSISLYDEIVTSNQSFNGNQAVVIVDELPTDGLVFEVNGYSSEPMDVAVAEVSEDVAVETPVVEDVAEVPIIEDTSGTEAHAVTDPNFDPNINHAPEIQDFYFEVPAYVMQGETNEDLIYAIPFAQGIPELDTGAFISDPDGDNLEVLVQTSSPSISGYVEDGVLYIAGNNPSFSGEGSVTITATDPEGLSDSTTVDVVVFDDDKTLTNNDGSLDYYVRWGWELDKNRILSVEKHASKYGFSDLSRLNRSINFSSFWEMPKLKDIEKSVHWYNELVSGGWWTLEAQLNLVTEILEDLVAAGVTGFRYLNTKYVKGIEGTGKVYGIFDRYVPTGISLRDFEEDFVINEAHRLGLVVIASDNISGDAPGSYVEGYQLELSDPDQFWKECSDFTIKQIQRRVNLGVEIASVGVNLYNINLHAPGYSLRKNDSEIIKIIESSQEVTPGPVTHLGGTLWRHYGDVLMTDFNFHNYLDIVSGGLVECCDFPFVSSPNPSLEACISSWEDIFKNHVIPFQQKQNKPFLAFENGVFSAQHAIQWGSFFTLHNGGLDLYDMAPSSIDQELFYDSFLTVSEGVSGFYGPGIYWVNFVSDPRIGGNQDTSMSPMHKSGYEVMRNHFLETPEGKRIVLDGSFDDWPEGTILANDPIGDARVGGDDLTSLRAFEDEDYLYFGIGYAELPLRNLQILLDTDSDGEQEFVIGLSRWQNAPLYAMVSEVNSPSGQNNTIGSLFLSLNDNFIEMRLRKANLSGLGEQIRVSVEDKSDNYSQTDDKFGSTYIIPRRNLN